MKILIQRNKDNCFLAIDGQWVPSKDQARSFRSSSEAIPFQLKEPEETQLFFHFPTFPSGDFTIGGTRK